MFVSDSVHDISELVVAGCEKFLTHLGLGIFKCCAQLSDMYAHEVYMQEHATDKPAPSLSSHKPLRSRRVVHPERIFDMLQESATIGISLAQLIQTKK